uniref:Signal transducer and activator of transcription b N-terminal domain-containing protein n=1 Tax=Heterorhabditis bacteriophora TaxID=37862 RepID=A0A1I7WI07_HETBA
MISLGYEISSTILFGGIGLVLPKVPVLIWLPSLLLLCSACVALSSLIYLNKVIDFIFYFQQINIFFSCYFWTLCSRKSHSIPKWFGQKKYQQGHRHFRLLNLQLMELLYLSITRVRRSTNSYGLNFKCRQFVIALLTKIIFKKILNTCENLFAVFEDEKQYLMGDVLLTWAMKQQKASIGTLWTQQLHYKQLEIIHLQLESEEFCIEPPAASFQRKDTRGLRAKFDDMRVAKKVQLRRDSVATKRYCLCYSIRLRTNCGLELVGKKHYRKVSLPFAVLVGPKSDVEAKLFLERSFADLVRHPLSDIPTHVSCAEMADALEMKFQVNI